MIDVRQSKKYARYLSSLGWTVERINNTNYFIKKIPLLGSILKIQRPKKIDIKIINKLIKKHRSFYIILEPTNTQQEKMAIRHGFRLSHSPYLPTKTLQIDLTQPKEKIFAGFEKENKRIINKQNNVVINFNPTIIKFSDSWIKTVRNKRQICSLSELESLKKSFGKNILVLLSKDNSSGAIFLIANHVAYYWQAFTNDLGRKNHSQYKIVWEGILWTKKNNAKIFDFEGIYDERFPNSHWLGFTHFKKSFGGNEIIHPGTFTKILLPFGV